MKKFWKICGIIIFIAIFLLWAVSLLAPRNQKIEYGATFSPDQATMLGLDWKQVYTAALTDLGLKNLRISAYWDQVQPDSATTYNFSDMDFEVSQAEANNTKLIIAVGQRLPRWPECHIPGWVQNAGDQSAKDVDLLHYIQTTVSKYKNSPSLEYWQVENEPFLSSFGICPPLDQNLLNAEIALVKKLDPNHPVLITDSGELDSWIPAGNLGGAFGTTFYRYVYSDVLHRYWSNFYFLPIVYRVKAGILRLLHPGKPVMIAELEAEPWTTAGIPNTSIQDQFQTMSLDHFNTITSYAAQTGLSPQYFWGVEWWYWMKTKQNHPEFWDRAKQLIKP